MNLKLGDTQRIIAECRAAGCTLQQAAYILATAKWETAHTMQPVRETLADTDAQAIARLDHAWQKGQLPWVSAPYWRGGWFGRGYVQLTHRANYAKAGERIGVDLVDDPSAALRPEHAAPIIVRGMMEGWFTGLALPRYIRPGKADYREARRVVNGTDRAEEIAGIARDYEAALAGVWQDRPGRTGWAEIIAKIIKAILALFRGGKS